MTVYREMPELRAALAAESWEWLQTEQPALAQALRAEMSKGAQPGDVRRFVMTYSQRAALAARMEQAAEYLSGEAA